VAVYLDSSALVKLVVQEPESEGLTRYLRSHETRVSCTLARVEVVRAVRPHGTSATTRARELLEKVMLIRLDDALLDAAANLSQRVIRSLDAIHLAAAQSLESDLEELVTYDVRMDEAALRLGLPETTSPGARY
jgi:predicted nucleic acid-binding protein